MKVKKLFIFLFYDAPRCSLSILIHVSHRMKQSIKKIIFSPYDKQDLVNIVEKRVGTRTFEKSALMLAGRKVAGASGDARAMLSLVSNAIRKYQETYITADEYIRIFSTTARKYVRIRIFKFK